VQTQIMQKPDSYFSHEHLNKITGRAVGERGGEAPHQVFSGLLAGEC
jgi:hypothetical protein